uniref:Putative reverse transcriptase and HNH endonuclease n=1 Tax=Hafniomonas laevis TaxID=436124 RepID=A0A0S2LPM9_9CHLO|nr:putative reverse transcriptase and HNH endonuclease [Hafniomonas laevis]ALO63096.1 putative reverse transcriptase and HNH endonuclease [Hafniomonas laevis]
MSCVSGKIYKNWSCSEFFFFLENKVALEKRGLKVSEEKTSIRHITDGFDFLGFTIQRSKIDAARRNPLVIVKEHDQYSIKFYRTLLKTSPSAKSVDKFKATVKGVFQKNFGSDAKTLIDQLNPIIRGWCQSKQNFHCSRYFQSVNHYIFNLCWRWIHRKHNHKSNKWLKEQYFTSLTEFGFNNHWVFCSPKDKKKILLQPSWFKPFSAYYVVRNNANPDDPLMKEYFIKLDQLRNKAKPLNMFNRKNKLLAEKQGCLCPVCDESLFNGEQLHVHHLVERKEGGSDSYSNLILLQYPCHFRITYGTDEEEWKSLFLNSKHLSSRKEHPPS